MPRAGTLAARVLRDGGRGRVVSVHRRAWNLLFEDGTLLGVLPAGRPIHPWALSVAAMPREDIRVGTSVTATASTSDAGTLTIGSHALSLADLEVVDLELHQRTTDLAAGTVERLRSLSGPLAVSEPFESRLATASEAFHQHRDLAALVGILGVGEGLTPSGDDLLVGVLAGLDLLRDRAPEVATLRQQLVHGLLPKLKTGTSRLSAQLLEAATQSYYPEPLLHLLRTLATGADFAEAVPPVLAQGHHSGRDTMRGVILGVATVGRDRGRGPL